ncbi:GAF domain-containing sensor histidine kinase [Candidatus Sumerlaeota bacterium]|nr:GAF domain-containing sensor histidine kinase [Candidatus Sumerlaeota bacterium]
MPLRPATPEFVDLPSPERWSDDFSSEERRVLHTVNQKVAAAESIDEAMNFLFDSTRGICPCDRIALAFLEEGDEGAVVVSHWARADYEPLRLGPGYEEPLEGRSLRGVLDSGRPRIINDLDAYLREHPESRSTRLIVEEGVRSSLTCPLIVENRPVGFVFRSSRKTGAYDPHQALISRILTERLSQAIEKIRRIERLSAMTQAYREAIRFVGHELKNPLASLVMEGETLLGGYVGDMDRAQHGKVQSMVDKANRLVGLIRDFLNMDRIERDGGEARLRDDVDLALEAIEPAIDLLKPQSDARRMRIERGWTDPAPRLRCDPELLQIVLVNLVGNAVKYGHEGGAVRIGATETQGRVRVSVWNEGPGFRPEERADLFRRFSRLSSPELMRRGGSGIGLYSSWRIVRLHGGRIWAESQPGRWAEFVFEIPASGPRE